MAMMYARKASLLQCFEVVLGKHGEERIISADKHTSSFKLSFSTRIGLWTINERGNYFMFCNDSY